MSLIYSRTATQSLTSDEVQRMAPAAFAETKAEHLTNRYAQLVTADFIPVMQDYGYVMTNAKQSMRKSKSGLEHKHHFISFAHKDSIETETRPEIIIYNSHDGSSAIKIMSGAFRFICSNGIIAGEGLQQKLYHNNSSVGKFEELLKKTTNELPVVMQNIEVFKGIELSNSDSKELSRKLALCRWEEEQIDDVSLHEVQRCRRFADKGNNFWNVWNRTQENVLKGNVFIKRLTEDNSLDYRKAKALTSVKELVKVNSKMWEVAEDFIVY